MQTKLLSLLLVCLLAFGLLAGCGSPADTAAPSDAPSPAADAEASAPVAGAGDMAEVEEVVRPGMVPVTGSALNDGTYDIQVDSSSSMFRIAACILTVKDGQMEAKMTMGGTGYVSIYPGTAEEAAAADEAACIPFAEAADGAHTFTLPVPALDAGVPCAAFSRKKELWYDRTLCFRADSLPAEAFRAGAGVAPDALNLADGTYTADVTLSGGSGRASVASPAKLTVDHGAVTAELIWSSPNYDYMKVEGQQYLPVNTEGNAVFQIPVTVFDRAMPVLADTTAMSQPHEIEYTLVFHSASIAPAS